MNLYEHGQTTALATLGLEKTAIFAGIAAGYGARDMTPEGEQDWGSAIGHGLAGGYAGSVAGKALGRDFRRPMAGLIASVPLGYLGGRASKKIIGAGDDPNASILGYGPQNKEGSLVSLAKTGFEGGGGGVGGGEQASSGGGGGSQTAHSDSASDNGDGSSDREAPEMNQQMQMPGQGAGGLGGGMPGMGFRAPGQDMEGGAGEMPMAPPIGMGPQEAMQQLQPPGAGSAEGLAGMMGAGEEQDGGMQGMDPMQLQQLMQMMQQDPSMQG